MEIRKSANTTSRALSGMGEGGAVQGKRSSLTPKQEEVKVKAAMSKS